MSYHFTFIVNACVQQCSSIRVCNCVNINCKHVSNIGQHSAGAMSRLVYLGWVIFQDLTCEKDVTQTIGSALRIVKNLNKIWIAKDISKSVKVLLYQTLVQPIIQNRV